MTKTLAEIDAQIELLKHERKEVEAAVKAEAMAAYAAFKPTFEWRVVWTSPRVMRVECRHDAASLERRAELKRQYPEFSPIGGDSREPGQWHGMSFYLVGVTIISTGGGSVILNLKDSWLDKEPQDLTQEQADAFRAGNVPEELRKGW